MMNTDDVQRLRSDLSTMQQVVGTQFPYGRDDIISMFVIGTLGALAVILSAMPIDIAPRQLRLVFAGLIVIVGVLYTRRYYKGQNRTIEQDREWRSMYFYTGITGGLALLFVLWVLLFGEVTFNIVLSINFFVFGIATLLYAATARGRRPVLGVGIPLLFAGFARVVIPYSSQVENIILFTTVALCGYGFAGMTVMMKRRWEG